ncbi:hypothetical protein Hanom_Chr17g01536751 [Helianthus anomalus]
MISKPSFSASSISYSEHCQSYAPEAVPTNRILTGFSLLERITSNYTGGQNILDQDPQWQRSIFFEATRNIFKTNVVDTYKMQARLSFFQSYTGYPSNVTDIKSNNTRKMLVFYLDGFWSVSTSKLCMVGSARWSTKEGNPLILNVVLKLKFAQLVNLNNSLVSGILESLASPKDLDYFDPISMMGFPRVDPFRYSYTFVSNEECNVTKTKTKTLQDSVANMKSLDVCLIFEQRFTTYKWEYPSNCKNCSLFGQDNGYLLTFMSLYGIQCSRQDNVIRFLVEFQDRRFTAYDQSFRPDISLIGEGTWNGREDELCIVACHILNQSDPLGSAHVGDCFIRLTLWFPEVRSITKTHTTEGQIWTTKLTDDLGSFRMAKFQSFDHSQESVGLKYEYTQMEKVRQICPKKKRVGDKYRGGKYQSLYYGFDMSVKHKNMVSRGSVVALFVGSRGYNGYTIVNPNFWQDAASPAPAADISTSMYNSPVNVSYEISFMLNTSSISRSGISSLNLSSTDDYRVEISAEGVYNDETGQVCMVGCRNLKNASFDCEILVEFQFPRGKESLTKGRIESLRDENDVLYFESLSIVSITYSETEESIWEIDLKIIMVLILDTLMCVFSGRQLFHLKKRPEMVNFISVLMMLILTLGHMVPLVLNTRYEQNGPISSNELLKVNEVTVRIMTMVAFNQWIQEIRTLFICLPLYIIGGLAMLLVNRNNTNNTIASQPFESQSQRSVWIDLRSYAGLTVDGFLFPQLLLNIFQNSKGNALSRSFYIGTTFVRLLPHAYDLYMGQKYMSHQFDRLYIYANPRAQLYSPSWDIVIVCGGLVFAVIVFLQQRFGGRFMLPKRFQERVDYEMVPVTSDE